MSARIPHLLTPLMTASELDAFVVEMLGRAVAAHGPAGDAWMDAIYLLIKRRAESSARRAAQTPSARRKSLSYRPASSTAH